MMNIFNKYLPDIKMHVEAYAKRKNLAEIGVLDIFNSRPDIRKLYINPVSFAYEAH